MMGPGEIARMKPNPIEGLAAEPMRVEVRIAAPPAQVGGTMISSLQGAFLSRIAGKYHLFVTGRLRKGGLGRTGLPEGVDDVLVAASGLWLRGILERFKQRRGRTRKRLCITHRSKNGFVGTLAYEGDETLRLARQLGYVPVVPPNPNRRQPWEYDRILYRRRNEIERLFRQLKGYRRVFCRFDKLDGLFAGFIVLALIVEALRQ